MQVQGFLPMEVEEVGKYPRGWVGVLGVLAPTEKAARKEEEVGARANWDSQRQ